MGVVVVSSVGVSAGVDVSAGGGVVEAVAGVVSDIGVADSAVAAAGAAVDSSVVLHAANDSAPMAAKARKLLRMVTFIARVVLFTQVEPPCTAASKLARMAMNASHDARPWTTSV
jgi:hypothetical protein